MNYKFNEEIKGKLVRHISNGEQSINIICSDENKVVTDEGYYIGNMNDKDIYDKINDFEEEWRETNWNTSDWADYYGCDEEDVECCMDDDLKCLDYGD